MLYEGPNNYGNLHKFLENQELPQNFTASSLDERSHVQILSNVCLKNADNPTGQARNGVPQWYYQHKLISNSLDKEFVINGTTYWINDYMAMGHAMYDTQLLSVLTAPDLHVDQIILQRAPCATKDLCNKNGGTSIYESFFKAFYGTMLGFAEKDGHYRGRSSVDSTNIFIRFYPHEKMWTPRPVRLSQQGGSTGFGSFLSERLHHVRAIPVHNVVCFEKVIRRTTNKGFFYGMSIEGARKFKQVALEVALQEGAQQGTGVIKSTPDLVIGGGTPLKKRHNTVKITIVSRGNGQNRQLKNEKQLVEALRTLRALLGTRHQLEVGLFDSGEATLRHHDQVMMASSSDILIATHGAFESNVIYMPEDSFLLEIRGSERQFELEGKNYHGLSHTFLVHYRSVLSAQLKEIKQGSYALEKGEVREVVEVVKGYLQYKMEQVEW